MSNAYSFIREAWKKPNMDLLRERMIEWRTGPSVTKLDRPTRIDRARNLGYKAKQGFLIARVRLKRGGRLRQQFKAGRKPTKMRRLEIISKSYKLIAEERANKKFHNCEVLNSYWVGKDGIFYWFEVILIDKSHPAIKANEKLKFIFNQKGRVYRGLTSAGRKTRSLLGKGKGFEKFRPSENANIQRKYRRQEKKGKHLSR